MTAESESVIDFGDDCLSLLVENEALYDEIESLRKAMTLILNEYHEVRAKHRKLVERTGHVDLK